MCASLQWQNLFFFIKNKKITKLHHENKRLLFIQNLSKHLKGRKCKRCKRSNPWGYTVQFDLLFPSTHTGPTHETLKSAVLTVKMASNLRIWTRETIKNIYCLLCKSNTSVFPCKRIQLWRRVMLSMHVARLEVNCHCASITFKTWLRFCPSELSTSLHKNVWLRAKCTKCSVMSSRLLKKFPNSCGFVSFITFILFQQVLVCKKTSALIVSFWVKTPRRP